MIKEKLKMKYILATLISTMSICCLAQSLPDAPRNVEQAYKNGTRSENGAPGENYWQNEAKYDIDIKFNPLNKEISGTVEIEYTNQSPDSLENLLIKLYPNLFKAGAIRDRTIDLEDVGEGVKIKEVRMNGNQFDLKNARLNGTNAFFPIDKLAKGKTINLEIDYSYRLESDGPGHRTGQIDKSTFFIAYFFPRVAVYDDIDGWDKYPFLGTTEFYNDFSNFDVEITVPKNFSVWATGDLLNSTDVFTEEICKRITKAEMSSEEINIIDQSDLENEKVTKKNEFNTFHFKAENVTDFAFATSDHYIWRSTSTIVDSTTNRRTRLDAVYNPEEEDFNKVLEMAKRTVEAMSFYYPKWPFPYSHETVFQGLGEMEFPMMVNEHSASDSVFTAQLTTHEIFHTMFPFYMGINEKKYAWMEEGWATVGEWLIYAYMYPGEVNTWGVDEYSRDGGIEIDAPIMTLTENLPKATHLLNSYFKPAFGFLYVQDMLGDERFYHGLHQFIRNWNGKHPIPWDLFNSMNEGSGENLNWFWKVWFYEDGFPDLAIESVSKTEVAVKMIGNKPVPINLIIQYTDGSSEVVHETVAIWKDGNDRYTLFLPSDKEISSLELSGTHIPDVDVSNNTWQK